MTSNELEMALFNLAKEHLDQGPGFAQEAVVLREAARQFGIGSDLKQQQRLLTVWHELFRNGTLSWGYDIDNPTAPFFHLA